MIESFIRGKNIFSWTFFKWFIYVFLILHRSYRYWKTVCMPLFCQNEIILYPNDYLPSYSLYIHKYSVLFETYCTVGKQTARSWTHTLVSGWLTAQPLKPTWMPHQMWDGFNLSDWFHLLNQPPHATLLCYLMDHALYLCAHNRQQRARERARHNGWPSQWFGKPSNAHRRLFSFMEHSH